MPNEGFTQFIKILFGYQIFQLLLIVAIVSSLVLVVASFVYVNKKIKTTDTTNISPKQE